MRVLFRTDGGAAIGLGHLQRCLSLAEAMRRQSAQSFFCIWGDAQATERAHKTGFAASLLRSPDDARECVAIARDLECETIVVDTYLAGADYLSALRNEGFFVVAIDDLAQHAFPNQMVVSFGAHAPGAGYTSSSGDTRFLLGPTYAILRPEYWDSPLPALRDEVRNVLVTSGGADPGGVMPEWIVSLDAIDLDFSMTAIVGPFFRNADAVHDAAASSDHVVRVVQSPAIMRPLQAAADLAVSAAGQTLYELCALGIPTVGVEIAANQRPQLDAFAAAGAVVDAGTTGVAASAATLIQDPAARRSLGERARAMIQRRGAMAVAQEILSAAGITPPGMSPPGFSLPGGDKT